ncbi:MAG: ribonuclease III [Syntrophales bacterium]|nr:ribonuclease III [Syntrophales bacterium]
MDKERTEKLKDFEKRISYTFNDISLLDNALTHRSYVNEKQELLCKDNERLEFLGDAVLELCISDILMKKFPDYTEGQLSKLRASLVNEQALSELAKFFHLGVFILLGKGEESSGGRNKRSILSNTFEALMAAIYLDSGYEKIHRLITDLFQALIVNGLDQTIYRDYKTYVQEISQNRFKVIPEYALINQYGPDHDKIFQTELVIPGILKTTGTGKNKKDAEQQAAKKALEELEEK